MDDTLDQLSSQAATLARQARTAAKYRDLGAALRRAEILARGPGHIGAIAFSRSGDPMTGEFGDATLLRKFGNVPEDLATL